MVGPVRRTLRSAPGLSLVETLVAISVVALLLGLLVPAARHAQRTGRLARSSSNLRQMGIAAHQYSAIWDAWPVAVRYAQPEGIFTTIAWDWEQDVGGSVRPGPLWRFTDHPDRVMQCPEFVGDATFGADPFTGYNYNASYLGGEAPFPAVGWEAVRPGLRPAACRRTGTTALFGAGGWRGGANKFMRAPSNREGLDPWTLYAGGQAFRYVGGVTPVCRIDGHVDLVREPRPGPLANDDVLAQSMGFPRNGFLADDDRPYDPR